MPVPKRKTSKRRKNQRASTKFIRAKSFTECSNCQTPLNPHVACTYCGFYKGKKVMKTKLDRVLKRGQAKSQAQQKHNINEEQHEHSETSEK